MSEPHKMYKTVYGLSARLSYSDFDGWHYCTGRRLYATEAEAEAEADAYLRSVVAKSKGRLGELQLEGASYKVLPFDSPI